MKPKYYQSKDAYLAPDQQLIFELKDTTRSKNTISGKLMLGEVVRSGKFGLSSSYYYVGHQVTYDEFYVMPANFEPETPKKKNLLSRIFQPERRCGSTGSYNGPCMSG